MKFKSLFLLIVHVSCVQLLQSMEKPIQVEDKKIAWDVILAHGKPWFTHNMIRSLAVSRMLEKKLLETAKERKEYCISLASNIIYKGQMQRWSGWHKYGTACGCAGRMAGLLIEGDDSLYLERLTLVDGGIMKHQMSFDANFNGFLVPSYDLSLALPKYRKYFFDGNDHFCCYAYGKKDLNGNICKNIIILHKLSSKGNTQKSIISKMHVDKKEVVVTEPLNSRNLIWDYILNFFKGA